MKRLQSFFISCLILLSFSGLSCASERETRHPFVSGAFYPADKEKLGVMIDGFLSKTPAREKPGGEIVALILPHAGYVYSGQTAAYGYKLIQGLPFDTVILIGLYHKASFLGASIWRGGDWETPLGRVPIDLELANAIYKEDPELFGFPEEAHLAEHSLEVHVPFLQKTLKNFKIVPMAMSTPSIEKSKQIAEAISKHIKGKKVLIIASTDMSHYHPDEEAREMDWRALSLLEKGDSEGLLREVRTGRVELCGIAATLTVLETAKRQGDVSVKVLNYANSGDVTGDRSTVVGYGSLAIYKEEGTHTVPVSNPVSEDALNAEQQKELLKISRQTLEATIKEGKTPEFDTAAPVLKEDRAVFVTLRKYGELRGCIGRLTPEEPLYLAVRNMTVESATRDPRFRPVRAEELEDINIEISVLSLPKRIQSPEEIKLGRDGVIVRQGYHSGVFLPKVAEETGWSKEEFLGELCSQKAGLPRNCWEDPDTELYTFTSFDFHE